MLRLRTQEKKFELNILGYEYPHAIDYDDANWLNVKIIAGDPDCSWSAEDCCLLTYELKELKDWLNMIEQGRREKDELSFLEGELSFLFEPIDMMLNVQLNFKFHPKGEKFIYSVDGDKAYTLSFPVGNLKKPLSESLTPLVEKYPERNNKNK